MENSKTKDKKPQKPYEPPRLFELGGGIAYAQSDHCKSGGSPAVGACLEGSMASATGCWTGGTAGKRCVQGNAASGGACLAGGTPSTFCVTGNAPP